MTDTVASMDAAQDARRPERPVGPSAGDGISLALRLCRPLFPEDEADDGKTKIAKAIEADPDRRSDPADMTTTGQMWTTGDPAC